MAREILIVVGAGASKEVNLPVGTELKTQISQLLNFRYEKGLRKLAAGDYSLHAALEIKSREENENLDQLFQSARHIAVALPQAISIDNFIDTHAGNKNIELVGKLAIVRSILKAEKNSQLFFDTSNSYNKINFSQIEDFWLTKLFRILTENCRASELPHRMSAITIIVFNYDRCIEHFLFHALKNYYSISSDQAADIVKMMRIYHPYGKVGFLPWESMHPKVEFGEELDPYKLLKVAQGIKTFTEGTDPDSSEILEIKKRIREGLNVLFLGFAFHRLNLQLLFPPSLEKNYEKQYFATSFGMSNNDTNIIRNELANIGGVDRDRINIRNDLCCHQLFHEFGRSISMV